MQNTKSSQISLKTLKQKIPINYFSVNIIVSVFIILTLTTLILFVIKILK